MRPSITFAAVAVAWFVAFSAVRAEERDDAPPQSLDELSDRIASIVEEAEIVGLAVALVDENGVFWSKGYGYADKENQTAVTADTVFRAGSISKVVTSLLAMQLAEQGRLDLEAPLRQVAPEIEFTNAWEETHPVRLIHLVEQTTGWDDIHPSEYRSYPEGVTIAEGLANNPASRTSRWRPGFYASYCNAGPGVLGYVLEKVTGESFEDLARKQVFEPLGMKSASFDQSAAQFRRIAKSYQDGRAVASARIWLTSSGALAVSANELGLLLAALMNGGGELLSPDGVKRMKTPKTSLPAEAGFQQGYGVGLMIDVYEGVAYIGHGGAIDSYSGWCAYRPDAGLGFVMLANSPAGGLRTRNEMTRYLSTQVPAPAAPEFVKTDLIAYEGVYRHLTPRIEMYRIASDILETITITTDGDALVAQLGPSGERSRYVPVGNGQFVKEGESVASAIFYEGPTGAMEVSAGLNATYRRIDPSAVYWRMAIIGTFVVAAVLAVLAALIWGIGRLFGRFRGAHRWRVWTAPMLALVAAGLAIAALVLGELDPLVRLAGPTAYARTFQLGTLAMPVFAFIGIVAAVVARDVARLARIHAGLTSAIILAFSIYLYSYGWIGLTLWAYQPRVAVVS